jgi:hypothetical protein
MTVLLELFERSYCKGDFLAYFGVSVFYNCTVKIYCYNHNIERGREMRDEG